MIVSWIQNSISPVGKSSMAFMDDARDFWNDLKDQFTQQDGSEFPIEDKLGKFVTRARSSMYVLR